VCQSSRQYLPLAADVDCAVVCVERTGEAFVVGEDEGEAAVRKVQSSSGRFQPVTAYFPPGYDNDRQGALISSMEEYAQAIDLSEPFARIKSALEALAEQDERFR